MTPQALVLVIHGAGPQKDAPGRFAENIAQLTRSSKTVFYEDFDDSTNNTGDAKEGIVFLPIEWHSSFHQHVDERMKSITLPSLSFARAICNEFLSDILYYYCQKNAQLIVNLVTKILNQQYDKFLKQHPTFTGKVAILAHSLGGIISFDVLSHQGHRQQPKKVNLDFPTLDFTPDFLFLVGSPIAAVLVQRGDKFSDYELPPKTVFENIFHLHDPLGYRVEPLIDPRYKDLPPELLCRPNNNQERFSDFQYFRDLLNSIPFPSLPNMPSLPNLPSFPTGLTMPTSALAEAFKSQLLALSEMGYAAFSLPTTSAGDEVNVFGKRDAVIDDDVNPRKKRRIVKSSVGKLDHDDSTSESDFSDNSQRSRSISPRPFAQIATKYLKRLAGASGYLKSTDNSEISLEGPPESMQANLNTNKNNIDSDSIKTKTSRSIGSSISTRIEWAYSFAQITELFKRGSNAKSTVIENPIIPDKNIESNPTIPPLPDRLDHCIQVPIMDSVVHAFLIGIRAHFSYWENKDFHHHLLARLLPH